MSGSRLSLGGTRIIEWSGGLNPSAVAGKLSVTKLTHNNCTGINASGIPSSTVKKMLRKNTVSTMLILQREKVNMPNDLANI